MLSPSPPTEPTAPPSQQQQQQPDQDLLFAVHNTKTVLRNELEYLLHTIDEIGGLGTNSASQAERRSIESDATIAERIARVEEDNITLAHAVYLLEATLAGRLSDDEVTDEDLATLPLDVLVQLMTATEEKNFDENATATSPTAGLGALCVDASTQVSEAHLPIFVSSVLGLPTKELLDVVEIDRGCHGVLRSICTTATTTTNISSSSNNATIPTAATTAGAVLLTPDSAKTIRVPYLDNSTTQQLVLQSQTDWTFPKQAPAPAPAPLLSSSDRPPTGAAETWCVLHELGEPGTVIHKFLFSQVEAIHLGQFHRQWRLVTPLKAPLIGGCPPLASDVYTTPPSEFFYRSLTFQLADGDHSNTAALALIIPLEFDYLRLVSQLACTSGLGGLRGPSYIFSHFRLRPFVDDPSDPTQQQQQRGGSGGSAKTSWRVFVPQRTAGATLPMTFESAAELTSQRFPVMNRMPTDDVDFCASNHVHPEDYFNLKMELLQDPLRDWFGFLDVIRLMPHMTHVNVWEAKAILAHFLERQWVTPVEVIAIV